jgi:hypothetical protein
MSIGGEEIMKYLSVIDVLSDLQVKMNRDEYIKQDIWNMMKSGKYTSALEMAKAITDDKKFIRQLARMIWWKRVRAKIRKIFSRR